MNNPIKLAAYAAWQELSSESAISWYRSQLEAIIADAVIYCVMLFTWIYTQGKRFRCYLDSLVESSLMPQSMILSGVVISGYLPEAKPDRVLITPAPKKRRGKSKKVV